MGTIAQKLKPHVKAIEASASGGCQKAVEIIELYEMHRKSPSDPAAPALCEAVFDDWMKDQ
jgi:hypothetical protein